ncbi:MAG: hypothetical protein KH009_02505 [Clostridiales bacterium]|nr:hypothetical protein [Clostridiales bacterium]
MKKILAGLLCAAILFTACATPSSPAVTDIQFTFLGNILLTDSGSVYTWGENWRGLLGQGEDAEYTVTAPKKLDLPQPIEQIYASFCGNTYYARGTDGQYYAWGDNSYQIIPGSNAESVTSPVPVDFGFEVAELSVSLHQLTVQSADGRFYGCGTEQFTGSFIHPELTEKRAVSSPKLNEIHLPTDSPIVQFQNGLTYRAFLDAQGQVYLYGCVSENRIIFPEPALQPYPEPITQICPVTEGLVTLGESGTLYYMGYDLFGIFSDDPQAVEQYQGLEHLSPEPITKLSEPVTEVFSGSDSVIVRTENGELYTWGYNFSRNNADSAEWFATTPTLISMAEPADHIRMGQFNSAIITQSGNVYIWGSNYQHSFSPQTAEDTFTPQLAFSITDPEAGFTLDGE